MMLCYFVEYYVDVDNTTSTNTDYDVLNTQKLKKLCSQRDFTPACFVLINNCRTLCYFVEYYTGMYTSIHQLIRH